MQIKNNIAFSLLEVLLAAVIFIISIIGVFATLNAVRVPVANKENQLAAAVFGKQVLEALYSNVNSNTYYNGCGNVVPCPNFDLSIEQNKSSLLHQVAYHQTGLTWPTALITAPCSTTPVLTYTVSCGDGGNTCGNPGSSVARQVTLNILWPNLETQPESC